MIHDDYITDKQMKAGGIIHVSYEGYPCEEKELVEDPGWTNGLRKECHCIPSP